MTTIIPLERDSRRLSGHRLFRRINAHVREVFDDADGAAPYFFCECRDDSCTGAVQMTITEYDALCDSGLFVVLPGHEDSRHDEVVVRGASYVVVRDNKQPVAKNPAQGRSRRTPRKTQRSSSRRAGHDRAPAV